MKAIDKSVRIAGCGGAAEKGSGDLVGIAVTVIWAAGGRSLGFPLTVNDAAAMVYTPSDTVVVSEAP